MAGLDEVHVHSLPFERFAPLIGEAAAKEARATAERLGALLDGHSVWNVNSTAVGGGVAEMLRPLLSYARGLGIDARWAVIRADPDFFRITKRIHHALHGSRGDGTPLDAAARARYEEVLAKNAVQLESRVQPGDVVLLHDPQTLGLAPHLAALGALVVWRCHIGHDTGNDEVERGWAFLAPYLEDVRATVFSRPAYVPPVCDGGRATIIQPSIDPFSTKNQDLDHDTMLSILGHVGLVQPVPDAPPPTFAREDGSPGRVDRCADILQLGPPPAPDAPLVAQVSRWDPLKDHLGVMRGFAVRAEQGTLPPEAALVLAGPNVRAVADDPEGALVFEDVCAAWRALPHAVRRRVHLAMLPTDDVDENAIIVNALQRHATLVVQKSLHEGFGLTVTEAMWKGRPVVASAVGGIQEQIVDGESGLLLRDPTDLAAFGALVERVLADPSLARRLGENARRRVRDQFLGVRHLVEYASLIERILSDGEGKTA